MPILFMYDLTWLMQVNGLGVALHLGIIATAVAYLLFARGLIGVPVATAVTLSLAEPLTAALLGVVIVGESLTPVARIGVTVLFFGLAILSYVPKGTKTFAE